MYLFILGVILGMGLVLAYETITSYLERHNVRKAMALEAEIQRRVQLLNDPWPDAPPFKPFQPIRHP